MVRIEYGKNFAIIDEFGAELKSLNVDGTEYIHTADSFWDSSSPVLFPICSALIDDTYYLDGKAYKMDKHGFAKDMLFSLENKTDSSATFLLTETKDTLKSYPYKFDFRIIFTLTDKKLSVEYNVTNKNDSEMFFSLGAHDGYILKGGLENYDIIFPKKQTLTALKLSGPDTLGYEGEKVVENSDTLPLKNDYFKVDALIFENIGFDSLILKNRLTNSSIKAQFKGFPYLLIWSKPGASFVCIEPWCGITDRDGSDQNIKQKQGIECILPGETFTRERSVIISCAGGLL